MRDAGRHAAHCGELFLPRSRLHVAHVFEQQHAELLARLRLVAAREADANAQGAQLGGVELEHHIAAGFGPDRVDKRALDRANERRPSFDAAQLERRRPTHAARREQTARRRVGGANAAAPIDDEHAVLHLFDHQPIQLRLLACELEAALGGELFSREPTGELAGEHGDDEQAAAGEPRLAHQRGRVAALQRGEPGSAEQADRDDRGGRQRRHARRQHAGHQHWQHQQCNVVEARRARQQVQGIEADDVGADRRQPLRPAQPRKLIRRDLAAKTRQQPHAQREREVADTDERHAPARPHTEQRGDDDRQQQRDAERGARAEEDAIDAIEGRLASAEDAPRLARQEARVAFVAGLARPAAVVARFDLIVAELQVVSEAFGAEERLLHRRAATLRSAVSFATLTADRLSAHFGACSFSYAARCPSLQNTPPRPGSASPLGKCKPHCAHDTIASRALGAPGPGRAAGGLTRRRPARASHNTASTMTINRMSFSMRRNCQTDGGRCSTTSKTKREPM